MFREHDGKEYHIVANGDAVETAAIIGAGIGGV